MKRLGCRLASLIEPCLSIEAFRVHDQRVSFPFSGGVSEPCRRGIVGQFASIEEDLPPKIEIFVDDHNERRRLYKFPRKRSSVNAWCSRRQAVRSIVLIRMSSILACIE